jgi:hypothetical protein
VCTATWLRRPGRLHLFFNRDEERRREPARPPRLARTGEVEFVAPVDGRSGGTWILASQRGLALALLNRSEGRRPEGTARSRGELPPTLAAATGPADLEARLRRLDLRVYPPFTLLALWLEPQVGVIAAWDGGDLALRPTATPNGILCSSGLGDEPAGRSRTAVWRAHRERRGAAWGPEDHRDLHRSHEPTPHAFSICMHRDEAATVSMVEVELGAGRARLEYRPGAPCQDAEPVEASLALDPAPPLR